MKPPGLRRSILPIVLGLFLHASTGCQDEDEAPVDVARAFAAAVQRGDVKAMLPLIEQGVVSHLQVAAEQASDQVGGRRSIEVHEMLQVVAADRTFAIASAKLVDNDGTVAHVKLTGPREERHMLELVLQEGSWRVRLPLPPGAVRDRS